VYRQLYAVFLSPLMIFIYYVISSHICVFLYSIYIEGDFMKKVTIYTNCEIFVYDTVYKSNNVSYKLCSKES
jgi:hypothetical protein